MKKSTSLAAAVALSVGSIAFAQQSAQQQSQQQQAQQQHSQQGSQMSQKEDETKFVQEASSGNNFEIQLSQFVEQHSQDQQVKQLAQHIIQDHQQAEQLLKQTAQAMGASVQDQLMPAEQAKLQEFQKKQGAQLDRAYIFCNVGDHHKDIMMYQWEARNAQNPQLKQYCEQTLPHLREHLQQVDQAAMSVTGLNEAQTAGEHMQGTGLHSGASGAIPGNSTNGGSSSGSSGSGGTGSSSGGTSSGTGGTSGSSGSSGTGGTSGGAGR